jgi:hypothetical protein
VLRPPLESAQYSSLVFGKTLRESGLVASMGSRGDALDNAACESLISTLKLEWIGRHRYQSRDQARLSIFQYIETFYNPSRRHSSLGGISPDEYERRFQKRQPRIEFDTTQTTRAAQPISDNGNGASSVPGRGYAAAGSSTVSEVPVPSVLLAVIVPPCASTIALEIERPSPVPWIAWVVAPSVR